MLCVILARCSIEAQAYAGNRTGIPRYGHVKLNGVAVWQAAWGEERHQYANHRGANMFIIDTSTCTLQESRRFDTHSIPAAAYQLRRFIQGLSNGTVLVGVSCDDASLYLEAAEATLSALGADVSDVGYRGAWAFVAEIGDPSKTVLDKELTEAAANARQPIVTAGAQCDLLYTVFKKRARFNLL